MPDVDSNALRRAKTLREEINARTGIADTTVTEGVKRLLRNSGTEVAIQHEAAMHLDIYPDPIIAREEFSRMMDYGELVVNAWENPDEQWWLDYFGIELIEYVETFNKNEYINTDYYFTPRSRIVTDLQFKEANPQCRIFGTQCDNNSYGTYSIYINSNRYWAYGHKDGTGNWIASTVRADANRHIFDYDCKNNYYKIDNGSVLNISPMQGNPTKNSRWTVKYFRPNNNDGSMAVDFADVKVKCWSSQVYENDVLVRNYIPAKRKLDNIMGFYDRLNHNFLQILGG